MFPSASRSVSVVLGLFLIPSHAKVGVRCPSCTKALVLHQPDQENPDRLLGVCTRCEDWFLMDLGPDEAAWIVVPLPDAAFFRSVPAR